MTAAVPTAQPAGFDYEQFDDAAADAAKAAVDRYRGRKEAFLFDTGRDLLAVKERVEHGLFTAWVEAGMGITVRTAQHMMNVAAAFGCESEKFSLLPDSALYKLAAPSTPQAAIAQIKQQIESGQRLKLDQIEKIIATERDSVRAQAAAVKEAARRAKLTEEERKAEDTQAKRRLTIAQKKAAENEKEEAWHASQRAKYQKRGTEGAQILIQALGAEGAADFVKRFRFVIDDVQSAIAAAISGEVQQ